MFSSEPALETVIYVVTIISAILVLFGGLMRNFIKVKKLSTIDAMESLMHATELLLNMISHPVSYLRLWALALAHEEISDVTWKMLFGGGAFIKSAPWILFKGYLMFLITFFVLILLEGLTVFLHALRL